MRTPILATLVLTALASGCLAALPTEIPPLPAVKEAATVEKGTFKGIIRGSGPARGGLVGHGEDQIDYCVSYAWWSMMGEAIEDYSFVWTWHDGLAFEAMELGRAKVDGSEQSITVGMVRQKHPDLYRRLFAIAPLHVEILAGVEFYETNNVPYAYLLKPMVPDIPMRAGVESTLHCPGSPDWADFFGRGVEGLALTNHNYPGVRFDYMSTELKKKLDQPKTNEDSREGLALSNKRIFAGAKRIVVLKSHPIKVVWPEGEFQAIAAAYASRERSKTVPDATMQQRGLDALEQRVVSKEKAAVAPTGPAAEKYTRLLAKKANSGIRGLANASPVVSEVESRVGKARTVFEVKKTEDDILFRFQIYKLDIWPDEPNQPSRTREYTSPWLAFSQVTETWRCMEKISSPRSDGLTERIDEFCIRFKSREYVDRMFRGDLRIFTDQFSARDDLLRMESYMCFDSIRSHKWFTQVADLLEPALKERDGLE